MTTRYSFWFISVDHGGSAQSHEDVRAQGDPKDLGEQLQSQAGSDNLLSSLCSVVLEL